MGIKKANSDIVAVKVGSTDISAIYHGSDLVWSGVSSVEGISTTNDFVIYDTKGRQTFEEGVGERVTPKFALREDGRYNFKTNHKFASGYASSFKSNNTINEVTINKNGDGYNYTSFYNCKNLNKVTYNCNAHLSAAQFQYCPNIEQITFNGDCNLFECGQATFGDAKKLVEIDLSNTVVNSSSHTFTRTFLDCSNLERIYGLENLDFSIATKVDSLICMFQGCSKLNNINVGGWHTTNIKDMTGMFNGCKSLTSINVANWDTKNVKSLRNMFTSCSALTSIDVSNWNAQNVTDMSSMFNGCSSLTYVNFASLSFPQSEKRDCQSMFSDCYSLTSLGFTNNAIIFDVSKYSNCYLMFYKCENLAGTIKFTGESNSLNIARMFYGCSKITSCDFSECSLKEITDLSVLFYGCGQLTEVTGLENVHFKENTIVNIQAMFGGSGIRRLNLSSWNIKISYNGLNGFTGNCKNLEYLNLSGIDATNLTNMNGFLDNNEALETFIVGNGMFNTGLGAILFVAKGFSEQTIEHLLTIAKNHPKTKIPSEEEDSYWETDDEYDDWFSSQIIRFNGIVENKIKNNASLSALKSECEDAGWCFDF